MEEEAKGGKVTVYMIFRNLSRNISPPNLSKLKVSLEKTDRTK